MFKRKLLHTDKGFTLVEIIAVLVILGVLASFAVSRYVDLEQNAKHKAVNAIIAEINARESLTWLDYKISTSGYLSDAKIFGGIDYNVNPDYFWNPGDPTASGGTLVFKGESFTISRMASSKIQPAVWRQK